jgi:hypothetical protein
MTRQAGSQENGFFQNTAPPLLSYKVEKRNLIGQILVDLGYVCMAHINEARRKQMVRPEVRLGEILLEMEALTPVQLEKGLELQKIEREVIGRQPS